MVGFIKQIMPKSLLGRSLMIIISPLILLQVIATGIFFESHWDKVTFRLARGLAGDISAIVQLLERFPHEMDFNWIRDHSAETLGLRVTLKPGKIPEHLKKIGENTLERMLVRALNDSLYVPFRIDTGSLNRAIIIEVQLHGKILNIIASRKRVFSSTTYVFIIWMVGSSLILCAVAMVFMRNQVKPIRRLADAADDFGKGRHVAHFKPEGAKEVRQAAVAFLAMRDRILRQISQRTDMLTGVSHDLRTPLTRMRLQLEMTENRDGISELKQDITEMEIMLDGYLAFARGEGDEKPKIVNLLKLIKSVVAPIKRRKKNIKVSSDSLLNVEVAPSNFSRALTNLIENSVRYANNVSIQAVRSKTSIELFIDDDGPGIPEEQRENVFRPFYRIEISRNLETGGVGLGMAIARDIVRGHGGDIILTNSTLGGVRVIINLPI